MHIGPLRRGRTQSLALECGLALDAGELAGSPGNHARAGETARWRELAGRICKYLVAVRIAPSALALIRASTLDRLVDGLSDDAGLIDTRKAS